MTPDFDKTCFVIMPFGKKDTPERELYDDVYENIIKKAVLDSNLGLICKRADDIKKPGNIHKSIYEDLFKSKYVIADLSERNPNVMYEIGMAHTIGIPVVIITQRIKDVPFDLQHHRCIQYSYSPKGCKLLAEKLIGTLRFVSGAK